MDELLENTALVDYDHPSIRDLVAGRGWVALDEEAKIRNAYDFVRDEIPFGYNKDDAIPASRVLARLQKGALSGIWYLLAPREIVHSWVEVSISGRWINIEGFILDMPYLRSVQRKFPEARGSFCGFGIATDCFESPMVEWTGGDTYIQKEGIVRDFGVFDTPDAFFKEHAQNLSFLKKLVYKSITRHAMNARVFRIRSGMATK
ncbi:MAG: transglutaminase [Spirochaetae bacterium HGW-Spirochaetae-3]|nr:MAG: transglutaminase [Spirochaetae bacterium HGW-Spirochaetae-3]